MISVTMPVQEAVPEEKALIVKFDVTEVAIQELKQKYGPLVISDNESYKIVNKARMEVVHTRTSIDKRRKELNEEAQNFIKKVNSAAKVLTNLIEPIEIDLSAKQKVWDEQQEAIRIEVERKEKERVESIQAKIGFLRSKADILIGKDSVSLQSVLSEVQDIEITDDAYMEFALMAGIAKSQIEEQIEEALAARLKWEEEEKQRQAELEELRKLRAEREAAEVRIKAEQLKRDIENAHAEALVMDQKRDLDIEKARIEGKKLAEQRSKEKEKFERKIHQQYLEKTRLQELSCIGVNYESVDLGTMPDEQYQELYARSKTVWNDLQERLRLEKAEQERKEREEFEKQAKIKAEVEAAEKVKQERETAEKKRIAEEKERKRQEALRPDKEKLIAFSSSLKDIKLPEVKDKRVVAIINEVGGMINEMVKFIEDEVKEL